MARFDSKEGTLGRVVLEFLTFQAAVILVFHSNYTISQPHQDYSQLLLWPVFGSRPLGCLALALPRGSTVAVHRHIRAIAA